MELRRHKLEIFIDMHLWYLPSQLSQTHLKRARDTYISLQVDKSSNTKPALYEVSNVSWITGQDCTVYHQPGRKTIQI